MSAMAVAQRMTAEEFIAAPVPEHGRPWNLIDGEVVMSDPNGVHGIAQAAIFSALHGWSLAKPGRGLVPWPWDVQIDESNVYVPDVLWYRGERTPDQTLPPPYPLPDLAAEIRSPSTWRYDTGRKQTVYEAGGLPELWLVDTVSSSILVHRRSKPDVPIFDLALELSRGERLTSPLLPEFSVPVSEIFGPS